MKTQQGLRYLFLLICLVGASHDAVAQTDLKLLDGSITQTPGASNWNFSMTFNRPPDFQTLDQIGRQANSFQFYIATTTNIPFGGYPPRPYASLVRGEELHPSQYLRIRDDAPPDPDPSSGGWGRIRGTVYYSLSGETLLFSIPPEVLNVTDRFAYTLELVSYGRSTVIYPSISGGPIIIPEPTWPGLALVAALFGMGAPVFRRHRAQ